MEIIPLKLLKVLKKVISLLQPEIFIIDMVI